MSQNNLPELTKLIRSNIITSTTKAGSGHPTTSLSAVEIMTVLWFGGYLHYDFDDPKYIFNDRMIFSKGHASPLLYSLYQAAGKITTEELLSLRKFTSRLEGHPTTELPWVDVATGSLGQGLSVGLGMALGIKYQMKAQKLKPKREPHVWVLMGDSEFAEGQIYEALQLASYYKLNNLVGLLDINRLGQRGATMLEWDLETYQKRLESFGWNTIVIEDGNNLKAVTEAFTHLNTAKAPMMILAKTKKGAGVSSVEDKDGWHGKALTPEMKDEALKEIGNFEHTLTGTVEIPEKISVKNLAKDTISMPENPPAAQMATREGYGEAMKYIAEDESVVILDAETSNSTYAEKMKEVAPDRFFEMYIAEQNMVSVALGMSKIGLKPFASSFAAFLSRAYDQIRMAQYSDPNIKIVGSHAGVSIGEDGSSQMALEDIAMMRALLQSTVLYPSDPVSTIKLVDEMRKHEGLSYLRLTRAKTDTLYKPTDSFPIGGSKVLRESDKDTAVIIAAGITVHEALKAQQELENRGIFTAVVDAYSVKPLDIDTIRSFAEKTGHTVVVEDHYPNGGLGEAVRVAIDGIDVKFSHLCVKKTPRSGTPSELLRLEEIDTEAIISAITNNGD
ncbi:transketolase [Candidatus Roizmanbacteria bacterium]|nr:MAG: transketolase [Candidatus Roizmanbacteria bacterium]